MRISLLLIFLLFYKLSFAQSSLTDNLTHHLEKLQAEYSAEKVHLHTDKPFYAKGDHLWFKAYSTDAANVPAHQSRILIVEITDSRDSLVEQVKVPLNGGLASGNIHLLDKFGEGNYRIAAYTNWMKNFDRNYIFQKSFAIVDALSSSIISSASYTADERNPLLRYATIAFTDLAGRPLTGRPVSFGLSDKAMKVASTTGSDGSVRVSLTSNPGYKPLTSFFTAIQVNKELAVNNHFVVPTAVSRPRFDILPEGGYFINGIRSKAAFKCVGEDGLGLNIKGTIVDEEGNVITSFATEHAGMGLLAFQPIPGKTYRAVIEVPAGKSYEYDLPESKAEGYVLALNNASPDSLQIRVTASPSLKSRGELTLVAQMNGTVQYVAKTPITGGTLSSMLEKRRFPTGILQVTLFSPDELPVAERLVFIDNDDYLSIDLNTLKPVYGISEKADLKLMVTDKDKQPVQGSFSISVIDQGSVPYSEDRERSIQSSLLLTPEISGYVERPHYYFNKANADRLKHLDILMLSQGWRRYNWDHVLKNVYPTISYAPEQGLTIRGTVTNRKGKPVEGVKISGLSFKGDMMTLDTLTNRFGEFVFAGLQLRDSTGFILQAKHALIKDLKLKLADEGPAFVLGENFNWPDYTENPNRTFGRLHDQSREQYKDFVNSGIMLKEAKVMASRIKKNNGAPDYSANLNGPGKADAVITAEQLEHCVILARCITSYVAGVVIENGHLSTSRSRDFRGNLHPMGIIVDGMSVSADYLDLISISDIQSIEVLKSAAFSSLYGIDGMNGLLVISLKRGGSSYMPVPDASQVRYLTKGLLVNKEFYALEKAVENVKDLRTTVYWDPKVVTNSAGLTDVSYLNTNRPGKYKIVVEGIDVNGNVGRGVLEYMVQ